MSKKENTANGLTITIRLPDDTPGAGYLTVKQGDLSTVGAFEYATLPDIWQACEREAGRLMEVIANPPVEPPAETKKASKTPLETVAGKSEPAAQDAAEDETETADEGEAVND